MTNPQVLQPDRLPIGASVGSEEKHIVGHIARRLLPFLALIYGLSLWLPTIIKALGVSDSTAGLLRAVPWLFAAAGLSGVLRHPDKRRETRGHIAVVSGAAGTHLDHAASVS